MATQRAHMCSLCATHDSTSSYALTRRSTPNRTASSASRDNSLRYGAHSLVAVVRAGVGTEALLMRERGRVGVNGYASEVAMSGSDETTGLDVSSLSDRARMCSSSLLTASRTRWSATAIHDQCESFRQRKHSDAAR
eukprot:6202892-Pleurochrysis_carterae.AAC.2